MGIAELPGVLLSAYLVDKIGRRYSLAIYMVGCAITTILFGFANTALTVKICSMGIFFFVVGAWVSTSRFYIGDSIANTVAADVIGGYSVGNGISNIESHYFLSNIFHTYLS
jgi:putative MFS transporter